MPVHIDQTETRPILVECRDVVTVEDAHYLLEHCRAVVHAQPALFLIDCSELRNLAPGVLNVLAGYADFFQHPNTRWLAFVTRSHLLRLAIQSLFGGAALKVFDDRETAHRFLQAMTD